MSRWNKTCNEFKEIRELINDDDNRGCDILTKLEKICNKYAKQKWDFAEDFEYLGDEIHCAIEDGDFEDEDYVDYYLREFYDLCDNARVWLGL